MSTITREFTKEQVVGHIRAKLDAHQNSTWPVSMASSAQMEKQILESALAALAAPPAPMLPEEMPKGLAGQIVSLLAHNIGDKFLAQKIWNACRAARLQGAEPVTTTNQLDFGENCWSCGKYFTYEQHSECDGYCPHCGSPVDLDDEEDKPSKVVPTQPTEEMVSRAWREATGKCDHETIKRIYATMVAAAPQQESE